MKKERIIWLDALKGFTIIFVVLGHILLGYTENNVFKNYNIQLQKLQDWIYIWHMPLFFVLSGIAFYISCFNQNGISNQAKVKKSCFNLLLLYLFWDITIVLLKFVFSEFVDNQISKKGIVLNIFLPDTLMWYLWVLIIFYVLFSKILWLKNEWKTEIILIILAIAIKIIDKEYNVRLCVKNLFYCAPFFMLGIILKRCMLDINRSKKKYLERNICLAASTEIILFTLIYFTMNYLNISLNLQIIIELITAICICLVCVLIFKNNKSIGGFYLFSELGKASLVIYLLHTYIITAFKRLTISMFTVNNPVYVILIILVFTLSITYVIYRKSEKNKILNYLFKPIKIFKRLFE